MEERAAIIEHDAGWPGEAAEAMAASLCWPEGGAAEWLRAHPKEAACYIVGDPLATRVNLARYAFDAVGTLDDVQRADPDLHALFLEQRVLWESGEDREEHAGGMVRAYVALAERLIQG